jgi:hypothetical protein
MTACNRYREWMVEALYAELDEARRAEFDAHRDGCAECTGLYEEMRATLGVMRARRRPDPGAEYWDAYWERLERRLARAGSLVQDGSRPGRRRLVGSWGFRVAAAVLILAAGVWMGRSVLAPDLPTGAGRSPGSEDLAARSHTPSPAGAPAADSVAEDRAGKGAATAIDAPPEERAGQAGAAPAELASLPDDPARRYLERSQVLLLALFNADAADADYATEVGMGRERAGALLVEGREVRKSLPRDDRRLRELVDQLELILREIAHLEADADLESVDVIRDRLAREGVLLRINLEQMRESGAPGSPASKTDAID